VGCLCVILVVLWLVVLMFCSLVVLVGCCIGCWFLLSVLEYWWFCCCSEWQLMSVLFDVGLWLLLLVGLVFGLLFCLG